VRPDGHTVFDELGRRLGGEPLLSFSPSATLIPLPVVGRFDTALSWSHAERRRASRPNIPPVESPLQAHLGRQNYSGTPGGKLPERSRLSTWLSVTHRHKRRCHRCQIDQAGAYAVLAEMVCAEPLDDRIVFVFKRADRSDPWCHPCGQGDDYENVGLAFVVAGRGASLMAVPGNASGASTQTLHLGQLAQAERPSDFCCDVPREGRFLIGR